MLRACARLVTFFPTSMWNCQSKSFETTLQRRQRPASSCPLPGRLAGIPCGGERMNVLIGALLLAPSIVQACQGPRTMGELARFLWDNPDYDVRTRPGELLSSCLSALLPSLLAVPLSLAASSIPAGSSLRASRTFRRVAARLPPRALHSAQHFPSHPCSRLIFPPLRHFRASRHFRLSLRSRAGQLSLRRCPSLSDVGGVCPPALLSSRLACVHV